jgi:hypothetical protein
VGGGGLLSAKSPATVATGAAPTGIAIAPDGASVYAGSFSGPGVWQFDVGAGGLLAAKAPASVATGGAVVGVVVAGAQDPAPAPPGGGTTPPPGTPATPGVAPTPTVAACRSQRDFTLTVGRRVRDADVRLNGRRLAVRTRDGRTSVRIDLRGRPEGTVTVRIRATRADGSRVSQIRRFRTCARGA